MLPFDLDFGDIPAAAGTNTTGVLIFRVRNQTAAAVNPRLFRVIRDCESELTGGAIISSRTRDSGDLPTRPAPKTARRNTCLRHNAEERKIRYLADPACAGSRNATRRWIIE